MRRVGTAQTEISLSVMIWSDSVKNQTECKKTNSEIIYCEIYKVYCIILIYKRELEHLKREETGGVQEHREMLQITEQGEPPGAEAFRSQAEAGSRAGGGTTQSR